MTVKIVMDCEACGAHWEAKRFEVVCGECEYEHAVIRIVERERHA